MGQTSTLAFTHPISPVSTVIVNLIHPKFILNYSKFHPPYPPLPHSSEFGTNSTLEGNGEGSLVNINYQNYFILFLLYFIKIY